MLDEDQPGGFWPSGGAGGGFTAVYGPAFLLSSIFLISSSNSSSLWSLLQSPSFPIRVIVPFLFIPISPVQGSGSVGLSLSLLPLRARPRASNQLYSILLTAHSEPSTVAFLLLSNYSHHQPPLSSPSSHSPSSSIIRLVLTILSVLRLSKSTVISPVLQTHSLNNCTEKKQDRETNLQVSVHSPEQNDNQIAGCAQIARLNKHFETIQHVLHLWKLLPGLAGNRQEITTRRPLVASGGFSLVYSKTLPLQPELEERTRDIRGYLKTETHPLLKWFIIAQRGVFYSKERSRGLIRASDPHGDSLLYHICFICHLCLQL